MNLSYKIVMTSFLLIETEQNISDYICILKIPEPEYESDDPLLILRIVSTILLVETISYFSVCLLYLFIKSLLSIPLVGCHNYIDIRSILFCIEKS